ncbi:DUF5961 family protein [Phenylobacterium sp.]|uniref:DUF5961 family protein n=1 Tax=Phenylobacterium sp. TaxID=1871053 RepID=UPI00272FDE3C|nr:DUF5961 family protein [Phenylobacterium sp.]MDP1873536.1 DUF5961 family protein [Phenylobacterium sp.]MDP3298608.1 DUF5961 family protein [Phenylobacterium sp.]
MAETLEISRRYSVHAHQDERHPVRIVEEASFEAAAIAYVEDFHPPADADGEIQVLVCDLASGHEHCFRIDLDSGEAEPCG